MSASDRAMDLCRALGIVPADLGLASADERWTADLFVRLRLVEDAFEQVAKSEYERGYDEGETLGIDNGHRAGYVTGLEDGMAKCRETHDDAKKKPQGSTKDLANLMAKKP